MKERLKTIWYIIRTTKNWFTILYFRILVRDMGVFPVAARWRNGGEFSFRGKGWYEFTSRAGAMYRLKAIKLTDDEIGFVYKGRALFFKYGARSERDTIVELFTGHGYEEMIPYIQGKVVLDLGAGIGESSVWFILNGAKKVIAVEGNRDVYACLTNNLARNLPDNAYETDNALIAGEKGYVYLSGDREDMSLQELKSEGIFPINKKTIPYFAGKDMVLKCDIEGYEYEAIEKTPDEILKKFSYMFFEYHYGPERLRDKLRGIGFKVNYTEPVEHQRPTTTMQMGTLTAIRQ